MYNSQYVANNIKNMCKERGVSVKKLLEDVELGFNTMSNMKTSMPKADNLAKIADYLECSVDYLLGRTQSTNTINNVSANNSNGIIGNQNSTITVAGKEYAIGSPLTEHELALLKIYKELDAIKQARLLMYADELLK